MHQDLCCCCWYCCCCCYCLSAVAVAAAFVAVAATVAADVATEHIVQCHHLRLKPPSMTLRSITFYSTPARSALDDIYMLCYYSTNSLSYSPIASNNEKCSYCSCCKIGDFCFSRRPFGDRWLSRECPLSMTTFCDKNKDRFSVFGAFERSKNRLRRWSKFLDFE